MMKVSSVIKLNFDKLQELVDTQAEALEQTAEALHTEAQQAQVFPRDKGTLQNEATFVDASKKKQGKVSIVSSTPYARRLYFHPEYHFSKEENPNARGEWYEDWLPGGNHADFCKKTYKKIYKRLAGL